MKQLTQFIQEKLHVSQYKGLTPKIAKYFNISNEAADIIINKFMPIKLDFKNKNCSPFEGVFLLAALLGKDNKEGKDIRNIATTDYHGRSDVYDYPQWYDEEDEYIGTDYFSYIEEHYGVEEDTGDLKFRKLFDEMVEFCKENKIEPDKVFNYSKEFK